MQFELVRRLFDWVCFFRVVVDLELFGSHFVNIVLELNMLLCGVTNVVLWQKFWVTIFHLIK